MKEDIQKACTSLGIMYYEGKGVAKEFTKALEYLTIGCKGDSYACVILGYFYLNGKIVKQNKTIAKEYYGKACDKKDQKACDMYRQLNEAGF